MTRPRSVLPLLVLVALPLLLLVAVVGCGRDNAPAAPAPTPIATPAPSGPTTLVPRAATDDKASASPAPRPLLDDAARADLLRLVEAVLGGGATPAIQGQLVSPAGEPLWVVVSIARPGATALVGQGLGDSLAAAATAAARDVAERLPADLRARLAAPDRPTIKVDVARRLGPSATFAGPEEGRLAAGFEPSRQGLWLPATGLLLLPEELASRGLADSEFVHRDRLTSYLTEGPRSLPAGESADGVAARAGVAGSIWQAVDFASFVADGGAPASLLRGNRELPLLDPDALLAAARAGGDFLLRHQRPDGGLAYQYQPQVDAFDAEDNLLRQAGTAHALAELATATGERRYVDAAERAIRHVLVFARPPAERHKDEDWLAIVGNDGEAKLGGAALAILAITGCRTAGGCADLLPVAHRLADFVRFQQRADGAFVGNYSYRNPNGPELESLYYPGESVLALARLHALEPAAGWREVAIKGADWLVNERDAKAPDNELEHDHWLLIALDELDRQLGPAKAPASWLPDALRLSNAIIGAQHRAAAEPDWIGGYYDPPRSTPTATRGEALVAVTRMVARHGQPTARYVETLRLMAEFAARCQLRPESVLYLPRPDRALGGWRAGLTVWAVRIDYVQHNLAAFLGLRELLLAGPTGG
jgi:hypothetical protein